MSKQSISDELATILGVEYIPEMKGWYLVEGIEVPDFPKNRTMHRKLRVDFEVILNLIERSNIKYLDENAHDNVDGYCCACEYDIAGFEEKLKREKT